MTRFEMGQVMAFLLKHRRLDSTASKRRGRVDERALAAVLRDASHDEVAELEGMLKGFGFDLAHATDFNTQGIAPGGHVFLLTRRLDDVNVLFGEKWIDDRMQQRNDKVSERRIWFTQLWLVLFSLFYTRRDRVLTEVSRYVETIFTRDDLAGAMHAYINDLVRKLGHETLRDDVVYACLVSESGVQVENYCDRFLGLMLDGALLDRVGDDRYRQSLLSAIETKNNHLQGLEAWVRTVESSAPPLEAGRSLLIKIGDSVEGQEN
jgi:hypothetical protein